MISSPSVPPANLADATAITIDSEENVGIGNTSPETKLEITATNIATGASYFSKAILHVGTNETVATHNYGGSISMGALGRTSGPTDEFSFGRIAGRKETATNGDPAGYFTIETTSGVTNLSTERFRITSDGRGLSQFTAKAWARFDADGTFTVNDSHNVSSVTDIGTGNHRVNFSNNMANANYSTVTAGGGSVSNNTLINVSPPQPEITTSSVGVDVTYTHGTANDAGAISVVVFGD